MRYGDDLRSLCIHQWTVNRPSNVPMYGGSVAVRSTGTHPWSLDAPVAVPLGATWFGLFSFVCQHTADLGHVYRLDLE